jgi:hypothetical protein
MAASILSDKLGVMAIVDQLRDKDMKVRDQIDLAERRSAIETQLREYYQQKGIIVEDDLITKGVQAYFYQRLMYSRPQLGRVTQTLASFYINRKKVLKAAGSLALSIVGAMIIVQLGMAGLHGLMGSYNDSQVATVREHQQIVSQRLTSQQDTQRPLARENGELKNATLSRLLAQSEQVFAEASALVATQLTTKDGTTSAQGQDLETFDQALATAHRHLRENEPALKSAKGLIESQHAFAAANERATTADLFNLVPSLTGLRAAANDALFNPAANNSYPLIEQAVDAYVGAVDTATLVPSYEKQIEGIESAFKQMSLDAQDSAMVSEYLLSARHKLEQLDKAATERSLSQLTALLNFGRSDLTVKVTTRSGVKAGVERTFNSSGGKSWFLIAEAQNSAGEGVSVPIVSAEDGTKAMADLFGVRVTQQVFNQVKHDKQDDGHIDDPVLGTKRANSLHIVFTKADANPDFILKW